MRGVDVVVVGAGPGGMSAALWAHRLELDVLLVDAAEGVGGQLSDLHNPIVDYLGIPVDRGIDLRRSFQAHLEEHEVPTRLRARVTAIGTDPLRIRLPEGDVGCRWLVVATGSCRRALGVPGEDRLRLKGVSDSASRDRAM